MTNEYIIELLRKGDKKAFQMIYDEFYKHLMHTSYRITENIYEAEDIAISAIESIFEKPHKFDTYKKLKAYLFTVMGNRSKRYLYFQRIHNISHKEIMHLAEYDHDDHIEAHIVRGEFIQLIYAEIEKLPKKRKTIFKMLYIDGLSPDEVAAMLNMTRDAVYMTKLKAIKQLRISLFK